MNTKPNILFITSDQQRRDSLRCYGASFMRTPHIDQLASEGQVYEHAYAVSPVCQPARASFIMGQYPSVTGVGANAKWLRPNSPTIAREFNKAGYHTAAIGKMHFYPWDESEGFTDRVSAEDKRHIYLSDDWTHHLNSNGYQRFHPSQIAEYNQTGCSFTSPLPEHLHIDGFIGDKAAEWLADASSSPFFCWVSFNSPHDPYDPPANFAEMYSMADIPKPIGSITDNVGNPEFMSRNIDAWGSNPLFRSNFSVIDQERALEWRRKYFACISFIDKQIGKIVNELERTGKLETTIIVFSSDHGDLLGDHGLPFKSNFYEGSVGIPLIIKGPGINAGTRVRDRLNWVDLHATLFAAAGIKIPNHSQGKDFTKLWTDESVTICTTAYAELDEAVMIQQDRYKLIKATDGSGLLYDSDKNPNECINYYYNEDYVEIRQHLENEIIARQLRQIAIPRFGGGTHAPITERADLFKRIHDGVYPFDGNIRI